ncbi:MAG: YcxB family protein [Lachnospiraceae bacterium]|nr:YcxB family protein [Lachnospiraceae bacterium]
MLMHRCWILYFAKEGVRFMDKSIKVTVKLKTADMFCFLMHYTYSAVSGIIGVLFSIGAVILLINMWGELDIAYRFLLIVCALLFTVINPFMLWKRAKRQVLTSPALKEPITYVFADKGVTMSMGKEKAELAWTDFFKIKKVAGRYILYTSRIRSNIVPVSCFESKEDAAEVAAMIKEYYKKK